MAIVGARGAQSFQAAGSVSETTWEIKVRLPSFVGLQMLALPGVFQITLNR
jgi:hypothetical protein